MAFTRMALPRASFALHSRQLQSRLIPLGVRYASKTPPPKPRVLEKPERFNPPSHPSRLRSKPRAYPGPPLSEHERRAQKTRRYPHMMPPEGSFMFWFLTSQMLHLSIIACVLVSLCVTIFWQHFFHTTPYLDILPPNSMFWAHPFAFISRYAQVYQMHVDYVSMETAEKRKLKSEDVRKMAAYRKAHGLEGDENTFGGWTARPDPEPKVESTGRKRGGGEAESDTYVDFDGKRIPVRKKWLGIF